MRELPYATLYALYILHRRRVLSAAGVRHSLRRRGCWRVPRHQFHIPLSRLRGCGFDFLDKFEGCLGRLFSVTGFSRRDATQGPEAPSCLKLLIGPRAP
jgi:hypothetical protein